VDKSSKSKQAATPKTVQIAAEFPETGFKTVLFFNRFGVERLDDHYLLHFGLTTRAGDVLAAYSTLLTATFVTTNRDDWLNYLGRLGSAPEASADLMWRAPTMAKAGPVEVTNAVRLARSGSDAEIRCYFVSLVAVVDRQQNQTLASKPLIGQPIALLQCSAEQQQLLLLSLLKA
jgi:hypothetical protein